MNVQTDDRPACVDAKMENNSYQHNVIISANGGGFGYGLLSGSPKNAPQISNNAYKSYGPNPITTHDDYSDSNPVVITDPMITGWTYSINETSSVYSAPVSFAKLPTQWGPTGFVVPNMGSQPSNPH